MLWRSSFFLFTLVVEYAAQFLITGKVMEVFDFDTIEITEVWRWSEEALLVGILRKYCARKTKDIATLHDLLLVSDLDSTGSACHIPLRGTDGLDVEDVIENLRVNLNMACLQDIEVLCLFTLLWDDIPFFIRTLLHQWSQPLEAIILTQLAKECIHVTGSKEVHLCLLLLVPIHLAELAVWFVAHGEHLDLWNGDYCGLALL